MPDTRRGMTMDFSPSAVKTCGNLLFTSQTADKLLETPRIADMEEINAFWTNVMRDKGEETKDRLKASELRAKAAGAFVQKIEHSGTLEVENPLAGLTTEELRKLADDG